MNYYDAIVVGAGLSGLSCAWYLTQRGLTVKVLESSSRAGGMLYTDDSQEWLADLGANTTLLKPDVVSLVESLNLSADIIYPNSQARKRYVYWEESLHAVPMKPFEIINSSLLPWSAKFRLMREPFVPKHKGEVSVQQFFNHRLGSALTDRLVDPFVSGIWAGNIQKLSMQAAFPKVDEGVKQYGSLFKWMRAAQTKVAPSVSFRKGMSQLTQRLAQSLPRSTLEYDSPVVSLTPINQGWALNTEKGTWSLVIWI